MTTLRHTPLFGEHEALGGKIIPFAGTAMPVQYPAGITAEHRAVREAAGLFDVSHMGEFLLEGEEALPLIQRLTVNDASRIEVGQAQYSAFCTDSGGVIDDLLVYRRGPESWMLVVNASRRAEDWAWVARHAEGTGVRLEDASDRTALLALQGPAAEEILAPLTEVPLPGIGYYRFVEGRVAGVPGIVSRTGYTGEDGFELYLPAEEAVAVWRTILQAGRPRGLLPAGLGARDSLRLEMGYALYGNELDLEHSALESGLGWIVKLDQGDFAGREALVAARTAGPSHRLVGLRAGEKVFPRAGYPVVDAAGTDVGTVTSGTLSPTLGIGIALARVPAALAAPGTPLGIRIRDRVLPAEVTRPPFHTGGSVRR